jgi:hypothetical protein
LWAKTNPALLGKKYNSHLRYFFRRHAPPCTRLLLVESGSRHLVEKLVPHFYSRYGGELEIDVVTCYAGGPAGVRGRVFNVNDYGGASGRHALWKDLAARQYTTAGIICSAEPILTKWKWWLGAKLPSKILVINENADYFELDRTHLRNARRLIAYRTGLSGAAAVPALARLVFFPLTLVYLLLYAGTVHLRRRIRLL